MGKKQKVEQLRLAVEAASAALTSEDLETVKLHHVTLSNAAVAVRLNDRIWPLGKELYERGISIAGQLMERTAQLYQARLERFVVMCACCHGTEFLVGERCSLSKFRADEHAMDLEFVLVVCKTCGDMRMHATDIAALAATVDPSGEHASFQAVTAPAAAQGPFR